jgi:hypothetical protein
MVFQGTVQNGVIVFPAGIPLPDGTPVNVTLVAPAKKQDSRADDDIDPIFRIAERAVDTGIPDLSINIDHYLYGHPKVTDGQ